MLSWDRCTNLGILFLFLFWRMNNIFIFLSASSLNGYLECLLSVVGSDYMGLTLTVSSNVSALVSLKQSSINSLWKSFVCFFQSHKYGNLGIPKAYVNGMTTLMFD